MIEGQNLWSFSDVTVIKSYNLRTTCGTKEELPYDTPDVFDDTVITQGDCVRERKEGGWRWLWGETKDREDGEKTREGAGQREEIIRGLTDC